MKDWEEWQQRVVDEKKELDAKINSLRVFLGKIRKENGSTIQKTLLKSQFDVMNKYSSILRERINQFF